MEAQYSDVLVRRINPATGQVEFSFTPEGINKLVGIAWDGSYLWVSDWNGTVRKYDTSGVYTGEGFNTALGSQSTGGLGYNTTDNTLWVGGNSGVYHYTTIGTQLGSFTLPAGTGGNPVYGLEFQAEPQPSKPVPGPGLPGLAALATLMFATLV